MDPRRTLIADTAIDIIGRQGLHALSHVAIDRAAALPTGSTSYYARKRIDVLLLTSQRVCDLDMADVLASQHHDSNAAAAAAHVMSRWLIEPGRTRAIARLELFLSSLHHHELAALFTDQRHQFARAVQSLTRGHETSTIAIDDFFAFFDGYLITALRTASIPTTDEMERAFTAWLDHTHH